MLWHDIVSSEADIFLDWLKATILILNIFIIWEKYLKHLNSVIFFDEKFNSFNIIMIAEKFYSWLLANLKTCSSAFSNVYKSHVWFEVDIISNEITDEAFSSSCWIEFFDIYWRTAIVWKFFLETGIRNEKSHILIMLHCSFSQMSEWR